MPTPKIKFKKISISIPELLHANAKARAEEQSRNLSAQIQHLIKQDLINAEQPKK